MKPLALLAAALLTAPCHVAAQSLPGWAYEHAFHRCEAYRMGYSWHAALAYADARHMQRRRSYAVPYSERQQMLNSAAARECLDLHRGAWEHHSGEIAP